MQHCTDETNDRDIVLVPPVIAAGIETSPHASPPARQICSEQDVQKTATGYVTDSICSFGGVSVSTHSEIIGDFNSAYTITTTSHSDLGSQAAPRDIVTRIEAKWLGACKADQKPGDIVMPGGFNAKDVERLRDLLPGARHQK